ncbi:signal peptide protein [Duganella sp. LX20W]|uniref:Signal peptide protein n=1 Tax=Rugamonas brunnea TaxID=2758569 RepID=A0A7W2EPM9_9BURK|nr:hypothetical protein [Rugamonas brunnea]MBA5636139.1 signal peptide protein [Rugamonas brunnea]
MKKILLSVVLVSSFSCVAFAQIAPAAAPVSAVCKDGTSYSGATMKGACRGHGGVDKKAAAAPSASASASAPAAPAAPAMKPAASAPPAQPAAGGGAGKVWVNSSSKVYHCQGDRYYGKTKSGEYMSESDAQAKGYRGDHGKACAK